MDTGLPYAKKEMPINAIIITSHPDPNVRAATIRMSESSVIWKDDKEILNVSSANIRLIILDTIINQFTEHEDWRVQKAAAYVIRRIIKDIMPEWDFYHFLPLGEGVRTHYKIFFQIF